MASFLYKNITTCQPKSQSQATTEHPIPSNCDTLYSDYIFIQRNCGIIVVTGEKCLTGDWCKHVSEIQTASQFVFQFGQQQAWYSLAEIIADQPGW